MDLARFYRERLCPCCGIHFGWDDLDEARREEVYLNWRQRWIANGKRWWSSKPMPPDCNPDE